MKFPKCFFLFAVLPFFLCSCVTRLTYENSMEVNLPIEKTWELCTNPNIGNLFSDKIEYYCYDEEFKTGSVILGRHKDRNVYIPCLLTEVEPYKKFNCEIKEFLCTIQSFDSYEEVTPGITKIHTIMIFDSPLVPFVKSKLVKEIERISSILKNYLDELGVELQQGCDFQERQEELSYYEPSFK